MASLCLHVFFVNPVKIECPYLYIKQALLLNSFPKISISHIYISCCPRSKVCMILAFPLRPFAYLLISGYCRSHSKRNTDVKSVAKLFLGVEGSATFSSS